MSEHLVWLQTIVDILLKLCMMILLKSCVRLIAKWSRKEWIKLHLRFMKPQTPNIHLLFLIEYKLPIWKSIKKLPWIWKLGSRRIIKLVTCRVRHWLYFFGTGAWLWNKKPQNTDGVFFGGCFRGYFFYIACDWVLRSSRIEYQKKNTSRLIGEFALHRTHRQGPW